MSNKSEKPSKKEEVIFPEDKKNEDGSRGLAEKAKTKGEVPEQFLKLIEDLREEIEELKKRPTHVSVEEQEMIDVREDYLETPATFFAFSTRFALWGDKRFGKESIPPAGEEIIFKRLHRYNRPATSGKGQETVCTCVAVVRSKKAAEWLREHSLFGIKFFERMDKVQKINVTLAEKMVEMNAVVSNMNEYQVIERCKVENIDIDIPDARQLRKLLIKKLAEKEIKKIEHQHKMSFAGERDEEGRKVEWKKVGTEVHASDDAY